MIDADGIYGLRPVNDRLILRFKGTMSEVELSVLHSRLVAAKKHKAAKGARRFPVPVGYVWPDAADARIMDRDPDEAVQAAIRDVFQLFATTGTAYSPSTGPAYGVVNPSANNTGSSLSAPMGAPGRVMNCGGAP